MLGKNHTFQIKFPFGVTLCLALLTIALVFLVSEGLLRIPALQDWLPTPSLGSPEPRWEAWKAQADQSMNRWGRIDCIFIGSSIVGTGIDLGSFERAYRAQSGRELHCAKLPVLGLPAFFVGDYSRMLVQLYHPQILIYGTNVRDYDTNAISLGNESVNLIVNTPWYQYREGHFNVQGWLVDHFISYRYYLALRNWMKTTPPDPPSPNIDLSRPPQPDVEPVLIKAFAHYAVGKDTLKGIEELATLNSDSVQILMVQVPMHHSFAGYLPHGEQDFEEAVQIVESKARSVGLPFWRAENLPSLPDAVWRDRIHLTPRGAAIYSEWLGVQLAEAVQRGEIRDPAQTEKLAR